MAGVIGTQRILVIEDSPADVMLLRMAMEEAGVSVDLGVCADGEAAIALIESGSEPPDLVILDLNIPCRDGLEILAVLRSAKLWQRTPVLVFSSIVSAVDQERIDRFGAEVLRKPQSYSGFVSAAAEIARVGGFPRHSARL